MLLLICPYLVTVQVYLNKNILSILILEQYKIACTFKVCKNILTNIFIYYSSWYIGIYLRYFILFRHLSNIEDYILTSKCLFLWCFLMIYIISYISFYLYAYLFDPKLQYLYKITFHHHQFSLIRLSKSCNILTIKPSDITSLSIRNQL